MIGNLKKELFQEYYENGTLGSVLVTIPDTCYKGYTDPIMFLRLGNTLDKILESGVTFDDIETIAIIGPALYRHFPRKRDIIHRPKYFLFGEDVEVVKKIYPREEPDSIDVAVITNLSVGEQMTLLPVIEQETDKDFLEREYEKDIIKFEAGGVVSRNIFYHNSGSLCYRQAKPVNVSFRHKRVLDLEEDEITKAVVQYGVPLFNNEKFNYLIRNSPLERNPLHNVEWEVNEEGILNSKIVEL